MLMRLAIVTDVRLAAMGTAAAGTFAGTLGVVRRRERRHRNLRQGYDNRKQDFRKESFHFSPSAQCCADLGLGTRDLRYSSSDLLRTSQVVLNASLSK